MTTHEEVNWLELTRRAALASHRLVGWVFFDPAGTANYAALGVPNGMGYYIATRGAALGAAGDQAVTAAFGSIHPDMVAMAMGLRRAHTTFAAAAAARDAAVVEGLHTYAPEICVELADLAPALWAAADQLSSAGRVLFAALRQWPRPTDDGLLSAWLAINCLREWRGDTHWAILAAEGIDVVMAGVLDGAWRNYPDDWVPRSRGADDAALAQAFARLEAQGLATDGVVNADGLAYRQELEDQLDQRCEAAWQLVGIDTTDRFLNLVEPVGDRLVERIDQTAGPVWMPAARDRKPPAAI